MFVARPTLDAFAAAVFILPSAPMESLHTPPPKKAAVECAADNGGLTLPKGFGAFIVADKITTPRHLVVVPRSRAPLPKCGFRVVFEPMSNGKATGLPGSDARSVLPRLS